MELSELVWLRDRLLILETAGPRDKAFGICCHCLYHEYLKDLFEELGCHRDYPVDVTLYGAGVLENPDALYPDDPETRTKWDKTTADVNLRWQLVGKLIVLIEEKIRAIRQSE